MTTVQGNMVPSLCKRGTAVSMWTTQLPESLIQYIVDYWVSGADKTGTRACHGFNSRFLTLLYGSAKSRSARVKVALISFTGTAKPVVNYWLIGSDNSYCSEREGRIYCSK